MLALLRQASSRNHHGTLEEPALSSEQRLVAPIESTTPRGPRTAYPDFKRTNRVVYEALS